MIHSAEKREDHESSDHKRSDHVSPGLRVVLRQLTATAVGIFETRLALAGVELEEEIQRLIKALLLAFALLLFAGLALMVFTLLIIMAFPEENRIAAMAGVIVVYLVIAGVLGLQLKSIFANRPPIFEATLGELERDREALKDVAHEVEMHAPRGGI